jgi:hypothetical protein
VRVKRNAKTVVDDALVAIYVAKCHAFDQQADDAAESVNFWFEDRHSNQKLVSLCRRRLELLTTVERAYGLELYDLQSQISVLEQEIWDCAGG